MRFDQLTPLLNKSGKKFANLYVNIISPGNLTANSVKDDGYFDEDILHQILMDCDGSCLQGYTFSPYPGNSTRFKENKMYRFTHESKGSEETDHVSIFFAVYGYCNTDEELLDITYVGDKFIRKIDGAEIKKNSGSDDFRYNEQNYHIIKEIIGIGQHEDSSSYNLKYYNKDAFPDKKVHL